MTTVKNFNSAMPAAPVLSGTSGALITLLDACLVTGFDTKSASTLVVAGGVATLTYTGTHSAGEGTIIAVSGVTGPLAASLNGDQRVTSVAANTVRFATPAADGTAGGSVTFKIAPAGWAKVFTGTNLAVYKSLDVASTGMFLRVDDSGPTNARLQVYEAMTDASTGYGLTPLESQCPGGLFWGKSSAANASARAWFIVADPRGVYFCAAPVLGSESYTALYAGDLKSRKPGDAYGFVCTGNQTDQTSTSSIPNGCTGYSSRSATRTGAYVVRSQTTLGGSTPAHLIGAHHIGNSNEAYAGSAGYGFSSFPNAAGNELLTAELEVNTGCLRGSLPGLLHPVQDMGAAFATGMTVDGTDAFTGKRLVAVRVGAPLAAATGTIFFDRTGPWR